MNVQPTTGSKNYPVIEKNCQEDRSGYIFFKYKYFVIKPHYSYTETGINSRCHHCSHIDPTFNSLFTSKPIDIVLELIIQQICNVP